MYKSLIPHFHHLLFIIILCMLNVYGQFVPETRLGHSAVYVKSVDRLYFIGGFKTSSNPDLISDFFYLNVNAQDKNIFKFTDLKSQVNLPLSIFHISELGGVNQDLIFIIGGFRFTPNDVYSFNIETNELKVPIVQGKVPPTRNGISSVSYEGKIYLFGGQTGGGFEAVYYNNFDVFDTINLNWQVGSLVNSPVVRSFYTASLVNGVIYYIGGRTQTNVYSPLTEIYQYDIVTNTWSLKEASAADLKSMPGPRAGHTSVSLDGKIVIYGGSFSSGDLPYTLPAKETISILDVGTLIWTIPTFDARQENPTPKLAFHTATIINQFMIIAFGNFTDKPTSFDQTNKEVYGFIFSGSQITSYPLSLFQQPNGTQPIPTTKSPGPQPTPPLSKVAIVGISIGSVSLVLIILSVLSITCKRTKKSKEQLGGVPNDPNSVEINDDKSHSEYQQQEDPPTILTESP